ncbi:hypothetical protein PHMEG_00013989 [Phytophthora megakarya]|uniref:FYVE-type domain-containing protein n=1 Tax=Phytophthora megakarya TaxID=4795 RepID=A0A225W4X8_9STRA|nr:hypothetical protein PHMEG_00013989 [Phytophthora megakarya]
MAPSFPISRLLLPKVKVSSEEHEQAKQMMTGILRHTVQAFETFAYDALGNVDTTQWKSIGSHDDLKLYKERDIGATSSELAAQLAPDSMLANSDAIAALTSPTMMMTGCCPGSVANAMSAAISQTQDDLSLLVSFMHEDVADCAVLHTIESPTAERPYHYLGYKYFVHKSPGAPGLVKHRDSLYLEYSGTCTTRLGEVLGFVLLHSVHLPMFPDLTSYNSIRALQSVRYLYRQRGCEVVEVFMLGNLDVSGMVIKPIADKLAQTTLFALVQLTDCAEAKNLTHMVQERRPSVLVRSRHPDAADCQLCGKTPKKSSLLSSSAKLLVKCECCGVFACSMCRDIKRIYVPNADHILGKFQKVPICMTCIIEANKAIPKVLQHTNSGSCESSSQRRRRSVQHNADQLSARSDRSVSAAVASVSAAVTNIDIRSKSSSYSSSASDSYSVAPSSSSSPIRQNQPPRTYRSNSRNGDWDRSDRTRPSSTAEAPIQLRDVQSKARVSLSPSPTQMIVSTSSGKPPVPSSNLSPQSNRTSGISGGNTRGSSNRSARSHSTGNSNACSPQDAMYARLLELKDVAEQTSAYLSSRGRQMSHRFPIQSLPPIDVSEQEHQASRQVMQQLLAHTIREFEFHSYHNSGIVDARRWKPQTARDDIELHRERKTGVTGNSVFNSVRHCRLDLPIFSSTIETLASPTMLLTGYGHGRVEDAMSAVVTESQQDLALGVKFKHQDVADCAIIKTLEPPTQEDPYHYLGYKFFVRKSPTEGHLFKHRHSVYCEFSGITHSSRGEQLGFHIMHSVELPQFPDLSSYNSIRALQSTRYIYRQKSNNTVEVFMLGNMDISGRIFKPLAKHFKSDMFFGVTRLLELAEVRRLSQMAQKQRSFGATTAILGTPTSCRVCNRSARNKLVTCGLCSHGVCKKCTYTKRVFISDNMGILGEFIKVPACRLCVTRANTGNFMSPHERVLRTPTNELKFDFHQPKPKAKGFSRPNATTPQNDKQPRPSRPRRETFPSESASYRQAVRQASMPSSSDLSAQEEKDVVAPEVGAEFTRRWSKLNESYSDRGPRLVEAPLEPEPTRPRARTRVSFPAKEGKILYEAPPKRRPSSASIEPQLPVGMSPAERAVMTQLFELSKIAEDTSTKARLNGIFCEQHWRDELKMEVEASRNTMQHKPMREKFKMEEETTRSTVPHAPVRSWV